MFVGNDKKFYLTNAKVSNSWPEDMTLDQINRQAIYAVMDEEGHVGFYHLTENGALVNWDAESGMGARTRTVYKWIFIISGAIVLLIIGIALLRTLSTPKEAAKNSGSLPSTWSRTDGITAQRKKFIISIDYYKKSS